MEDSNVCSIYNSVESSLRHSLLNCNIAQSVWVLADKDLPKHLISNKTNDARFMLLCLFHTPNKSDLVRVLAMLRSIWWARGTAIHDHEF